MSTSTRTLFLFVILGFARSVRAQTPSEGQALLKKLAKGHPMVAASLFGIGSDNPTATLFVPTRSWSKLTSRQKIALGMYAKSLPAIIRRSPDTYVGIPAAAPVYSQLRQRAASLCDECFSIIVGPITDSQTVVFDHAVIQGETAWQKDPNHSGARWSEFLATVEKAKH